MIDRWNGKQAIIKQPAALELTDGERLLKKRSSISKTTRIIIWTNTSQIAHTLAGHTSDPHPKPVKECTQCSVSGESCQ
jgi:hypothetical protein